MRLKLILSLFILSLLTGAHALAQKQNVYFLKDNGRYVQTRDSADFVRVIREPDSASVLYNVFEFYLNGKGKFIGKSSKINPVLLEGQCISYYKNGDKKVLANYENGQLKGAYYEFYPNGKIYSVKEYNIDVKKNDEIGDEGHALILACKDSLGKPLITDSNGYYIGYHDDFKYIEEQGPIKSGKRDSLWSGQDKDLNIKFEEHYAKGLLTYGTSTDSAGIKYNYKQREVKPMYIGGQAALYKYLANKIKYPDYAVSHNIEGVVVLKFVVKKDGTINNIEIYKSINELLDNEAVRVVKNSKGWQAGVLYGKPVNFVYVLPVNFALSD